MVLRVIQSLFRPVCQYLDLHQICNESDSGISKTTQLIHSVVNIGSEMKSADIFEVDKVKKIISHEPVLGRNAYGRDELMIDYFTKLFFIANRMPHIDDGKAIIRRFCFIRFGEEHQTVDSSLAGKIERERSGIFLQLLQCLPELMELSVMPEGSPESEKARQAFIMTTDPIQSFIVAAVESWSKDWMTESQRFTEVEQILRAINRFCEARGINYKDTTFRCKLYQKLGCESKQKYVGKAKGSYGDWKGSKISVVYGLVLKPEWVD
jgi:phage/plasmid-associated DNA primase